MLQNHVDPLVLYIVFPRMTILEKQTMLTERISQVKKARPASLSNHQVFRCSLKRDGIGLVAIRVDHVVDVQYKIVGLCVLNGNFFIPTSNLVQTYSFQNGSVVTEDFRARSLCSFRGGLLFTDKDWNNIRLYSPSKRTTTGPPSIKIFHFWVGKTL